MRRTPLLVGVLALAAGCSGSGDRAEQHASSSSSVAVVDVDGIGPVATISRSNAEELSSCTAYEHETGVSITFVSGAPDQACDSWTERQAGTGESWSANSTDADRTTACIFFVLRFGLVEVGAPETALGNRVCSQLVDEPRWIRFEAAEEAKKNGRPIPLLLDVPAASMEPTLHCDRPAAGCASTTSDFVAVELAPPSNLKRGDIVAFEAPPKASRCGRPGSRWLQRLVGLPGERWQERSGFVFIDDERLTEPYVEAARRDSETIPEQTIRDDEYFVLGDNRVQSCDSRAWGPVPGENVIGRVSEVLREK